jgi:DNA mismatch endonuclease (patch repair protein)
VADYPHPSSQGRSANMKANRRTDTKPELALRHALHRLGYRYRKDYRLDLDSGRRVRPDIAFTARKVAVFVDGCFWHACPEHGSKPKANEWYWGPKLIKNVERDRVNDAALILAGWTVVRLWEHVPLDEAVTTVVTALTAAALAGTATGPAGNGPNGPNGPNDQPPHEPRQDQPPERPGMPDDSLS